MKNKHFLLVTLLGLLFIVGCSSEKKEVKTAVTLREEWFPSACYAGDIMAMNETSKNTDIQIKVEPGAEDIDPVKLVIAGQNDFGVAGGDRIISANKKGADLVVLGTINYKSPTCFISLASKNILTPKDFEGKVIGVMSGNNTEYIYRALLSKTKINEKKIKEVEAPYDLATFITGSYDVRPAFAYDEPVSLDLQHIKYNTIKPENYGVAFIGPVIFARRDFIIKNKELVQNFINAMCSGWQNALKYPKKAIGLLKGYDKNIDTTREYDSLIKGEEYFAGENNLPLYLSRNRWNAFVDELINVKLIDPADKKIDCFDNSFVANYYKLKNN